MTRADGLVARAGQRMKEAAKLAHFAFQRFGHVGTVCPTVEEGQGLQKITVMFAVIGFVTRQCQHPVGCGGKQKRARGMTLAVRVVEQLARQVSGRGFAVEQVAEPLKLIHDYEVGFQGVDAGVREFAAKTTDQGIAPLVQLIRIGFTATREEVADRFQFREQFGIFFDVAAEAIDDPLINTIQRQLADGGIPAINTGGHLKQIVQAARPRHPVFEHPQQQGAFLRDACGRAQVKGRAWCQADEVDLVGVEPLIAPDLERYKGHARR